MGKVSDLYRQRVADGRIRPDPAQQSMLPHLDRVLDDIAVAPAPEKRSAWRAFLGVGSPPPAPAARGLYLWGGVGRGKSMLMDLMAEAATVPARRVHFHEFMQEIQAGLNRARQRGDQDTVRPVALEVAAQVRLLCFDEMQITDIADAMIVGRLFQVLLEQGVVIVTTSNRVPEDLYKHGLNRQLFLPFIDLIRQRMEVVCLDSQTDHRQGRTAGGQVWFCPADAAARTAMDGIWDELTQGAAVAPQRIAVGGRSFDLPQVAAGVGRTGFWDLCGTPLGPADYLALSRAVKVLMIDAIPRLSASNYNEAKRFVTLIDALYEARVRLVASAADQPEQLYNEGEGSFEFERTASRLREMQDADWGR
ncbi:cell division protein ZapE [Paracoccus sediminis]|uniref:Cell division protein ZapE n=1 Tax=Paracoccus sediminis TaxID=1214787 RepID=A0A238W1Y0_9RHOB|nr:cell division protein ZapE [Paracoccus sediminis]TBN51495.1 cell division protein ZapE [Paracoccus sediminis]SNR40417.1 cell division protein ZapE [Paracoccus sediminis]